LPTYSLAPILALLVGSTYAPFGIDLAKKPGLKPVS
jgi:hypothetical protein